MIRILIADDHTIVREGIRQCLSDATDIYIADEASSGKETLHKALTNDYDVILLDITMPDINGLDILKQLKTQKPKLKALVLTIHPEELYAMRVLRAGAAGYITKGSAPQELITAIRKVSSGGKYISLTLAEKLACEIGNDIEKPLYQTLSDREYEILLMIAVGKKLSNIAEELSLSIKTVSTYRSRILRKLNLKSNAELAIYALSNQLIY